jgi:hypothetical protein
MDDHMGVASCIPWVNGDHSTSPRSGQIACSEVNFMNNQLLYCTIIKKKEQKNFLLHQYWKSHFALIEGPTHQMLPHGVASRIPWLNATHEIDPTPVLLDECYISPSSKDLCNKLHV